MKHKTTKTLSMLDTLGQFFPDTSKTTLRSWLKEHRVFLDGVLIKTGHTLVYPNQEVTIAAKPHVTQKGRLQIYYEDRHLVVIEKPADLLTVSTAFETDNTAHALLKEHYRTNAIYVVHRLDQHTSGVMLFARTEEAREKLKEMFEKHALQRTYVGIVEGVLDTERTGTWRAHLFEDGNYVVRVTDDPSQGALAITHYTIVRTDTRYTWLQMELETGRKNQIRVHCQLAGHPIVGDKKYGAHSNPIKRLCLHAHALAFVHPITGKSMRFVSPVPEAFHRLTK